MTEKEMQVDRRRNRAKKKKRGIIALFLLVLVFAAVGGWWWFQSTKVDTTTKYWFDKMAQDGTLEGKSPQEVKGVLNSIVEEGMFRVSINARAVFQDGKSEGSIGIENVPDNLYYSRVILRKDDDGSILYSSDGLKPGQYIDKIKLEKNLPAGEYPCTAQIIATDPETLDDIGQVHVEVQVIVVN